MRFLTKADRSPRKQGPSSTGRKGKSTSGFDTFPTFWDILCLPDVSRVASSMCSVPFRAGSWSRVPQKHVTTLTHAHARRDKAIDAPPHLRTHAVWSRRMRASLSSRFCMLVIYSVTHLLIGLPSFLVLHHPFPCSFLLGSLPKIDDPYQALFSAPLRGI